MEGQFQLLFDKMKIEMQNQTAELKDSITKSIMESMDEKLILIVEENKKLKIRVDTLEKEIESLKRAGKSNNIVVFGIEEKEKSTIELLRELKDNIKQDLNIDIVDNEVNKIHRIGKRDPESNKPRPVICSFVNYWKKNEIIKNKKNLKNIYIMEDYSKEALKKRKELQTKLVEERKKGKIAYLKNDKLIIKDNNTSQEKRKRDISTSPSSPNTQPKKQPTLFATKANRTNAFDKMRSRSNSFSNISNITNSNNNQ
ncbi:hypothetical protein ABMA27_015859 [Loxostege sticticalis]|uniref:Endonuclease-reverse transcriptase n=1 Tax=Loxostege sticticalis TaxID=481309 RepID=A0ABR3I4N0_LOXSC